MPFREDGEKIDAVVEKMRSWKVSIFDVKATTLSLYLCMITRSGVDFANTVMESATLRVDKQFGISSLTTKQTLALYVPIFVKLTEDTYNQKFNEESVLSLIGAFRGVAAVGHILLKDALANVNPVGHISSNHSSVQEADNAWREFEQKMNNLEEKFRAASNSTKAFQILKPTMDDAMTLTMFFVSAVVARHERVLGYVPGTKGRKRSTMALGDEGPDALGTGSGSMGGT
ncbi:hypothetical protein BS78_06G254400 [Paspalum vaginatum]|nr:hypothetical protein BS78_06G254400 [Paspalum vaginatum]